MSLVKVEIVAELILTNIITAAAQFRAQRRNLITMYCFTDVQNSIGQNSLLIHKLSLITQ